MITRCNLPDELRIKGKILKPVIGGHLKGEPFLTKEFSGVDVTQNGWAMTIGGPDFYERKERKLIIAEAKRRGLSYRLVSILARRLRGKRDLRGSMYSGSVWVFVEVPSN